MKRASTFLVAGVFALVTAGCGHDECAQGDLNCYLEHLMLFPLEDDGEQLPTKRVEASAIPAAADPPAVRLTNVPPGSEYTTPRTLMPLEIGWQTDECKQVPGFCFRLCLRDAPLGLCTRKAECTSSLRDAGPTGAFRVAMGYLAQPEELRERFFAVVTPICSPGGGDAAKALDAGGAGVAAGAPLVIEQVVPADEDPTGGVLAPPTTDPTTTGTGGAAGGAGGAGGSGGAGGAGGG